MGIGAAIVGAGALGAGASILTSSNSASAANSAASAQENAAAQQQATTMAMFNQTQANLQPYMQAGTGALTALQQGLGLAPGNGPSGANGGLLAPFQPTMAQLEGTPGYQFTKQQGLEAAQNGFAAQGLGSSGAAVKGATNYAEGLASTTYQQQFQNYLTQNQQLYNMLGGVSGSGQNAAAGLGALSLNASGQINSALGQAGAASAAGTVGAANAVNSGINGITGSLGQSGLIYALNQQGMFGGSGGSNNSFLPPTDDSLGFV